MKTLFEQQGGQYELQGDYWLPCVTLPNENDYEIGVWGCECPVDTSKHSLEASTEPVGETATQTIFQRASQGQILQFADYRNS